MPKQYGGFGKFIINKKSTSSIFEYSLDNSEFIGLPDTLILKSGYHQLLLKHNNDIDYMEINVFPNEEINFDLIDIIPANCNGKNGRIIASVTGSGTASFPNTGIGTILLDSTNVGQQIDLELDAGEYTLTAFLNENIQRDTSIFIPITNCEVYFPNSFYPNSTEGLNKRFIVGFEPDSNPIIKSYLIYDRWGSLIYQRENFDSFQFNEWWDGTCFGDPCESGVYVYKVTIEFPNDKTNEETGTILLMR